MSKPRSRILEYFEINSNDKSKTYCPICKDKLKRGDNDPRSYGTSGLINHLFSNSEELCEYSGICYKAKKRKLKEDDNTQQSL